MGLPGVILYPAPRILTTGALPQPPIPFKHQQRVAAPGRTPRRLPGPNRPAGIGAAAAGSNKHTLHTKPPKARISTSPRVHTRWRPWHPLLSLRVCCPSPRRVRIRPRQHRPCASFPSYGSALASARSHPRPSGAPLPLPCPTHSRRTVLARGPSSGGLGGAGLRGRGPRGAPPRAGPRPPPDRPRCRNLLLSPGEISLPFTPGSISFLPPASPLCPNGVHSSSMLARRRSRDVDTRPASGAPPH